MKKRNTFSRLCVMLLGLFMLAGYATVSEAATCSDFSYTKSGTVVQIKKYNGLSGEVDLSAIFPEATEITIDGYAFYNKPVTRVVLPGSVVSIGEKAFYNCTSLQTVTFASEPDILILERGVFEGCTSLTVLDIPDCVRTVPERLCHGCSSLSSVRLPEGCTSIGKEAFIDCNALAKIQIPGGCTSIGGGAFARCDILTSVVFGENADASRTVTFGQSAFSGCGMLKDISIPEGCSMLPAYLFQNCTGLQNVELPATCTSVMDQAFSGCNGLCLVTFKNPNTSIGADAFPSPSKAPKLVICCNQLGPVTDFAENSGISYQTSVQAITITRLPQVTDYMYSENGSLNVTGMEVKAQVASETSDTGFVVEEVEPAKCSISGFVSTKPGTQTITVSYAGQKTSFDIRVFCNLAKADVTVESAVYTGNSIKPTITAYGQETGKALRPDTDYICKYQNNIDAGTASVKLEGRGYYKGEKTVSFQILPKTLNDGNTTVSVADMDYTGSQLKPVPQVVCGMKHLLLNKDYVVTYGTNTDEGKGLVRVQGIGNYDGVVEKYFYINESALDDTGNQGTDQTPAQPSVETPQTPASPSVEKPQKGKFYVYKSMKYKVTGSSTVTFVKPVNAKVKKVVVPSKVKILGKSFKVTKVGKKACYGCSKVTSVNVGNYVTVIGDEAFAKCRKLKNVTIGKGLKKLGRKVFYKDKVLRKLKIRSKKLTSVGKGTLKGVKKVTILVPSKKEKKAYTRLFSKAK